MLQKPIIPTTSSWRACSNRHAWRQIRAWSVMSFRISGYAEVITKRQASTKCRNCRWKLSMVLKGPWYCVGTYSDDSTGCITDTDTFCPQLFNRLFEPRENHLLRCSLERKTYFFATISPRIRSMTMHVLLLWTRYVVSTNITVFVRTNWIACVFAIMVNMLILMQNFEMERTSPRCWNICWKHLAITILIATRGRRQRQTVLLIKLTFGCDSRADNARLPQYLVKNRSRSFISNRMSFLAEKKPSELCYPKESLTRLTWMPCAVVSSILTWRKKNENYIRLKIYSHATVYCLSKSGNPKVEAYLSWTFVTTTIQWIVVTLTDAPYQVRRTRPFTEYGIPGLDDTWGC